MKIVNYEYPHSSFLSIEKDMEIITNKILKNERLKRLLYYTTNDALDRKPIGEDASLELFGKNIKIVPKLYIDGSVLNYIVISFDNFTPNATNPEYRNNTIAFDIICHFDQWQLKGFQLRPYRIAAELDSMFDKKHLTGIGKLEFLSGDPVIINDEFAGIRLIYAAIHGDEDKKPMSNPIENDKFVKEFDKTWNDQ